MGAAHLKNEHIRVALLVDGLRGHSCRFAAVLALVIALVVIGHLFGLVVELPLITVPVLTAPLAARAVNPLWFGIIVVILAEIAIISPPVGMLSFIVHRLAQHPKANMGVNVKLADVFRAASPFILMVLVLRILLIFFPDIAFPDIALWLPIQLANSENPASNDH